jgi:hypothetical protein
MQRKIIENLHYKKKPQNLKSIHKLQNTLKIKQHSTRDISKTNVHTIFLLNPSLYKISRA